MKTSTKSIVGPAVAIAVAAAAGSVAASSNGNNAAYPPVPTVNRNSAIPQKDPLAARPLLAPKSGAPAETGAGGGGPSLGIERPAAERQVPDSPVAATAGPVSANGIAEPE